jgi:hypothetical protein
VTQTNQTPTQNQSYTSISLALDAIDAYEFAYEAISDLSVILEDLKDHTMDDCSNERLLRMLSIVGFRYASDQLKLIDKKIDAANKTLDELRVAEGSIKSS